jgi:O-antigen/teichoic acid export membrane protein
MILAELRGNFGGAISRITALALGTLDKSDVRARRSASVIQGVLTGIANRVVGVAVGFLSVPLTIGYLGQERYAVWTLIGSVLTWMALADLGIGNGLANAVARALGQDKPDLVRAHVSTAIAVLAGSSIVLGLIVAMAWPFIDWAQVFNVSSATAQKEAGPAMATAIGIFLLQFPLSVIERTYNASQNGKLNNYWSAAGNVLSLAALFAVTKSQGGLVLLVLAVSGTSSALRIISGVWLFRSFRPEFAPSFRRIEKGSVKAITTVGVQFFLIQIIALSIFQTDNLMIAHFLGASATPTYSVTYRFFELTSLIQSLLFGYLWVAYTEAISRGDIAWVKRTFKRAMTFSLCSTSLMLIPLVFFAQPIIHLWTKGAILPPQDLVLWMAAWSLINALCSPIACLLAAASQMKTQLIYGSVLGVANFFASIYLIPRWGVKGAIAGTVISYLLFNCGPTILDVTLLIRRLSLKSVAHRTTPGPAI